MVAFAPCPLMLGDIVTVYEKAPSLWHCTGVLRGITMRKGTAYYQIVDLHSGHVEEIKRSDVRRIDRRPGTRREMVTR